MGITRRQWRAARAHLIGRMSTDEILEIEESLEFERPTPKELDDWAAMEVMGFRRYFDGWYGPDNARMMDLYTWQPTRYIGQAIECVNAMGVEMHIELSVSGRVAICLSGTTVYVHTDYNECKVATRIVETLYGA